MSTDLGLDLVSSCRGKMAYFRIKELKDVLNQLGLAKQGRKQDLVDRVLTLLSDDQGPNSPAFWRRDSPGKEDVAKIIDDAFRKMQSPYSTELTSKTHADSDFNLEKPQEETFDSHMLEMKVRCPCGSSLMTNQLIQCEDPSCGLWQHIDCVIIPEKPVEGVATELPSHFYCAICRIKRADPFWVTIGQPLLPLKLSSSGISSDSANTEQVLERTFILSRADRELLHKTEYGIQVWCLLLNDNVPFRMQWPQYAKLQINDIDFRVVLREEKLLLGINGRDDGPIITTCSMEGTNKITLTRRDARHFCIGVRIAKRMTLPQVLGLIPKEGEGELFDDALARVQRCVGGGTATEASDSDSDIEVVADSVTVNLRCPMSGSRIKVAGRFKPCVHMGCFDLETFVELNQRSRKWQCPICLKNYSLENVIIDPYFSRITSLLQSCEEDVNEIDVKPDGSWRVKNEKGSEDLSNWHLPDGTLCGISDIKVIPDLVIPSHTGEEALEGHGGFKIGIKRNRDGIWQVNKPDNNNVSSSGSPAICKFESNSPVAHMSSSATGVYTANKEVYVSQEDRDRFCFSLHNDHPVDFFQNKEPRHNFDDRRQSAAPSKDPYVIVLSDSDDDNVTMVSPGTAYGNSCPVGISGIQSFNETGFPEKYSEDPGQGTDASSTLGLFGNASDDFGIPIWAMPQTDPGFQIFENEVFDGFNLVANDVAEAANVQDFSSYQLNTEMTETLIDNPLAFTNDPSLQIFLPTCSAEVSLNANLNDHTEASTTVNSDDWVSLSLAAGGDRVEAPSCPGDQRFDKFMGQENGVGDFNEAALLLSMKDDRKDGENSSNQRFGSLFSGPSQPSTIKPVFVTIDTDSD